MSTSKLKKMAVSVKIFKRNFYVLSLYLTQTVPKSIDFSLYLSRFSVLVAILTAQGRP
jgi:hypothetical protein